MDDNRRDESRLPHGRHAYEDVAAACERGIYRFAAMRAASGRLNYLCGINPEQLTALKETARHANTGLIIIGSRVSGPRLRQRSLHPALKASLPLKTNRRDASAMSPEVKDVEIDKTAIKEFGREDPQTSDLTALIFDAARTRLEIDRLAVEFEVSFGKIGCPFPIRVFSHFDGRYHRTEGDFIVTGELYLRSLLQGADVDRFTSNDLRQGFRELYAVVGDPLSPTSAKTT